MLLKISFIIFIVLVCLLLLLLRRGILRFRSVTLWKWFHPQKGWVMVIQDDATKKFLTAYTKDALLTDDPKFGISFFDQDNNVAKAKAKLLSFGYQKVHSSEKNLKVAIIAKYPNQSNPYYILDYYHRLPVSFLDVDRDDVIITNDYQKILRYPSEDVARLEALTIFNYVIVKR
jgi:hypothetical protein